MKVKLVNVATTESREWLVNIGTTPAPETQTTEPETLAVVLNDGETFSSLKGCRLMSIPPGVSGDDVDVYIKDNFSTLGIPLDKLIVLLD